LRTRLAGQIMSAPVDTLAADATVAEARRRLVAGPHGAYPLVDGDGRCVGLVARGHLLQPDLDEDAPVLDQATHEVLSVAPGDPAMVALQALSEHGVDHLPVIDGHELVGIVTRADLLRASSSRFEQERPQPGWRPAAWRPRPRPAASTAAATTTGLAGRNGDTPDGEPPAGRP
jgi:CIC family chloride channel protein